MGNNKPCAKCTLEMYQHLSFNESVLTLLSLSGSHDIMNEKVHETNQTMLNSGVRIVLIMVYI